MSQDFAPASMRKTPRQRMLDALVSRDQAAFDELIATGAPWNGSSRELQGHEMTPLMWAAMAQWPEAVEALVRTGSSIDEKSPGGSNPLIEAVSWASSGICSTLIDLGASLDALDANGDSLMHVAARRADADVVELLLARGMAGDALNRPDHEGQTPLGIMAAHDHAGSASALLRAGADANLSTLRSNKGPCPPLCVAAERNSIAFAKALLAAGADLLAEDPSGRDALMIAARGGHTELTRLLLEAGADPRRTSSTGMSTSDPTLPHLRPGKPQHPSWTAARQWAAMLDLRDELAGCSAPAPKRPGSPAL